MPTPGSNLYMHVDKVESLPYTEVRVRLSDGNKTTMKGGTTCIVRDSDRKNYSKNGIRYIGGVLPWRDPSSYSRECTVFSNFAGSISGVSSGTQVTREGCYASTYSIHYNLWTYPYLTGTSLGFETLDSERNRARTECLLRLKESKVNLGQFLAEARESASTLASGASTLFGALLAIKRGHLPKIPGSKGLANGYLQFQYGWAPLCSDLKGIYDDFQEKAKRPMIFDAVRQIRSSWDSSKTTQYFENRRQNVRAINHCHLTAKLSNSFVTKLNAYGLMNPLSLGRELVPYSFVVDWAMPIGNVLEALSSTAGLDFVAGYEFQKFDGSCSASLKMPSGYSGVAQSVEADRMTFRRTKLGGFPSPVPYVKNPLSTSHVASALALWRQLLK